MVLILVFLTVGIGVGIASGEPNLNDRYSLEHTGNSGNLLPGESTQKITGIEIHSNDNDARHAENVSLFIDLLELKENDINISSVDIKTANVSNGNLNNVNKSTSEDEIHMRLDMEHLNPSDPLIIHEIVFNSLGTESAKSPSQAHYEFGVAEFGYYTSFEDLKSDSETVDSKKFKIFGGEIEVPDQATESTQLLSDERTTGAVSMSRVNSNTNSTIVVTRGREKAEIVGIKSYPNNASVPQEMSIKTPRIGGNVRSHIIPNSYFPADELEVGDTVSNSTLETATASDSAQILLGAINFDNVEYNSSSVSNITVTNTRLLDTQDDNTPFVISLHPITVSGNIDFKSSIGHSKVLTGRNKNANIDLDVMSEDKNKIRHTNRFAISMRLAKGYDEGDIVELDSTTVLPNSDLDDQFVENGVADKGVIFISESFNYNANDMDYLYDEEYNVGNRIYGGHKIGFKHNKSESDVVELHQFENDNKSIVSGIASPISNSSYSGFNTSNLKSGKYTVKNSGIKNDPTFHLVGAEDQYLNISRYFKESDSGGLFEINIEQDTRNASLAISNTTNQSTTATVNLTTAGNGTIPVTLNTYAVGDDTLVEDLVTVGPGGTVESVQTSGANETLRPGTYELAVRSAHGSVTTADTTTFTVEPRSTDGVTTYTTDAVDPDALDTTSDVREAIDADTLTSSTTVNSSETVVYAVDASGLTGLPAAENATLEVGADLERFDGFDFGITANSTTVSGPSTADSEPTLTRMSDTDDIGPAPEDASVHVDEDGLYLVADGADAIPTDEEPADGEAFTAAFRVADDRLRSVADPEDDHTVTADLTYVDADAPSDPVDGGGSDGAAAGGGSDGGATGSGSGGGAADGADTGASTGSVSGSGAGASDGTTPPSVGPREVTGDPVASDVVGSGSRVRAVANLNAPYRDHPDADPDGTGAVHHDVAAAETPTDTEPSTDTEPAVDRVPAEDSDEAGESLSEPDTPGYENAPIRSTAYDVPGFGLAAAMLALLSFARLAARRG